MTLLATRNEQTSFDGYLKEMTRAMPHPRHEQGTAAALSMGVRRAKGAPRSRDCIAEALLAAVEPVLIDLQAPVRMHTATKPAGPVLRELYNRRRSKKRSKKPKYEDKEVQHSPTRANRDSSPESSSPASVDPKTVGRYELETILPPKHERWSTRRSASRRDVTTSTVNMVQGPASPPIWDTMQHSQYVSEKVSRSFEAVNALFDRNNQKPRAYDVTKKFENASGSQSTNMPADKSKQEVVIEEAHEKNSRAKQGPLSPLRTAAELMKFLTKRIIAPETEIKFENALKESSTAPISDRPSPAVRPSSTSPLRSRHVPSGAPVHSSRGKTHGAVQATPQVSPRKKLNVNSAVSPIALTRRDTVAETHCASGSKATQRSKQFVINEHGMKEVSPRGARTESSMFNGLRKKFLTAVRLRGSEVTIPEDFRMKQERPMIVSIDTDRKVRNENKLRPQGREMRIQALPSLNIRQELRTQKMPALSINPEVVFSDPKTQDGPGLSGPNQAQNVRMLTVTHDEMMLDRKTLKSLHETKRSPSPPVQQNQERHRGYVEVCHTVLHQNELAQPEEGKPVAAVEREHEKASQKTVTAMTQTSPTASALASPRSSKHRTVSDTKVCAPQTKLRMQKMDAIAESEPELRSFRRSAGMCKRRMSSGADERNRVDYDKSEMKSHRSQKSGSRHHHESHRRSHRPDGKGVSFTDAPQHTVMQFESTSYERLSNIARVSIDPNEYQVSLSRISRESSSKTRPRRGGSGNSSGRQGFADLVRGLDAYAKGVAGKLAWYEQYDKQLLTKGVQEKEALDESDSSALFEDTKDPAQSFVGLRNETCTNTEIPEIRHFGGNIPSNHKMNVRKENKVLSPLPASFIVHPPLSTVSERITQSISSEIDQIDDNLLAIQKRCASYRSRPHQQPYISKSMEDAKGYDSVMRTRLSSHHMTTPLEEARSSDDAQSVHVHEFRLLSEIRRELYAGGADSDAGSRKSEKEFSSVAGERKKKRSSDAGLNCTRDIIVPYGAFCAEQCSIDSSDDQEIEIVTSRDHESQKAVRKEHAKKKHSSTLRFEEARNLRPHSPSPQPKVKPQPKLDGGRDRIMVEVVREPTCKREPKKTKECYAGALTPRSDDSPLDLQSGLCSYARCGVLLRHDPPSAPCKERKERKRNPCDRSDTPPLRRHWSPSQLIRQCFDPEVDARRCPSPRVLCSPCPCSSRHSTAKPVTPERRSINTSPCASMCKSRSKTRTAEKAKCPVLPSIICEVTESFLRVNAVKERPSKSVSLVLTPQERPGCLDRLDMLKQCKQDSCKMRTDKSRERKRGIGNDAPPCKCSYSDEMRARLNYCRDKYEDKSYYCPDKHHRDRHDTHKHAHESHNNPCISEKPLHREDKHHEQHRQTCPSDRRHEEDSRTCQTDEGAAQDDSRTCHIVACDSRVRQDDRKPCPEVKRVCPEVVKRPERKGLCAFFDPASFLDPLRLRKMVDPNPKPACIRVCKSKEKPKSPRVNPLKKCVDVEVTASGSCDQVCEMKCPTKDHISDQTHRRHHNKCERYSPKPEQICKDTASGSARVRHVTHDLSEDCEDKPRAKLHYPFDADAIMRRLNRAAFSKKSIRSKPHKHHGSNSYKPCEWSSTSSSSSSSTNTCNLSTSTGSRSTSSSSSSSKSHVRNMRLASGSEGEALSVGEIRGRYRRIV